MPPGMNPCTDYLCRGTTIPGYLGELVTVMPKAPVDGEGDYPKRFEVCEVEVYGKCLPCAFSAHTDVEGSYAVDVTEKEGTW